MAVFRINSRYRLTAQGSVDSLTNNYKFLARGLSLALSY